MKTRLIQLTASILLSFFLLSLTSDQEVIYKEQDGVRISYTKQQLQINEDQIVEYLILKIENRNAYGVKANWKLDIWYNGLCRTCDKPAPTGYEFSLDLKPGEVVQGDLRKDDLMLKIWYRNVKPEREGGLTKFEFTNLQISKN